MKKILLIPDSFKGTMTSLEICSIMAERIHAYYPDTEIVQIPAADGGEGTVDCFLTACGGKRVSIAACGPNFEEIQSFYCILADGKTAVIEVAACAGLPLAGENPNPRKTTTYGAGILMRDAARRGCKKIIVGLGGSATNDFGTGAAAAAGARFFDDRGTEFTPTGETLSRIARIDAGSIDAALKSAEIITICDIDNPLYGKNGAAYVFAPQKGADPEMTEFLDGQLRAAAAAVKRDLGQDVAEIPGAGAAGGMGGGMTAFFGSRLKMGIETILDTVNFDSLAKDASLIFTGEGRIDEQSLRGKVVIGVARRAKKYRVLVIAIVGDIGGGIEAVYDEGVSAIFSINRVSLPFEQNRKRCKDDMKLTIDNLMRFFSQTGIDFASASCLMR
jgi:glycerate kinase